MPLGGDALPNVSLTLSSAYFLDMSRIQVTNAITHAYTP